MLLICLCLSLSFCLSYFACSHELLCFYKVLRLPGDQELGPERASTVADNDEIRTLLSSPFVFDYLSLCTMYYYYVYSMAFCFVSVVDRIPTLTTRPSEFTVFDTEFAIDTEQKARDIGSFWKRRCGKTNCVVPLYLWLFRS